MGNTDDSDFPANIVDLVADTPISRANPPNAFFAEDFATAWWAGLVGQTQDPFYDPIFRRAIHVLRSFSAERVIDILNIELTASSHFVYDGGEVTSRLIFAVA